MPETRKIDGLPSVEETDDMLLLARRFLNELSMRKKLQFNRRVSVGDLLTERGDNAALCGFGEGTTMYDNVLVLGDVKVGRNTWIGPNCVLDGSGGGLEIGDFCSISAGVHIYSHDTVHWSLSGGKLPIRKNAVSVGDRVYIGPQSIVVAGVTVGRKSVIGANSFVNRNVEEGTFVAGSPAVLVGRVEGEDENVQMVPVSK
ncbi:acyltransferase [soil metagenome]